MENRRTSCAVKGEVVPCPPPEWSVPGTRIRIGGHAKATVRYAGSVDDHEGYWIGLEWDDVHRGKHDGCYKGKRYFRCARTGSVASFVRYNALCEQVYTGRSLEDAICMKYKDSVASLSDENTVVVGAADVQNVLCCDGALNVLGLEGMDMSSCVMSSPVLSFMKNIQSLDLSENLLSSWHGVVQCISSLPNLRVVNLSRNMMMPCDDVANIEDGSCSHINTLVLNHCLIQTRDMIMWIGRVFPHVKELFLFDNQVPMEGWGTNGLPFASLEKLDLGSNGIVSWSNVVRALGNLLELQYLSLEGNGIESVCFDSQDEATFQRLEHLNLGDNSLKNWNAIQEICKMKSVTELRFSGNPLCADDASRDRVLAIGRMASLTWINGSDVSASERKDCELVFLRRLEEYTDGGSHISSSSSSSSLLLESRIRELEHTYGVRRNASGNADACASLGSNMVHIRLIYGSRNVSKKVPHSLTIDKLKRIIHKLLGIKVEHQALTLQRDSTTSTGDALSEIISSQDGSKELSFYGIEQGSWDILVEESENHLDSERMNRRKSHDAKIEHQEHEARILAGEQQRLMQFG